MGSSFNDVARGAGTAVHRSRSASTGHALRRRQTYSSEGGRPRLSEVVAAGLHLICGASTGACVILQTVVAAVPPFTREAEHLLRAPGLLNWSTVTLLGLVAYVYAVEIERSNWNVVLAGIAFWLMDWVNKIANALVLHFNGRAALWTVTGTTSFLILIGLTVEISLFFAINGVVFAKLLPAERSIRILGLPNRWALAVGLSLVSVGVELLLHADGVFHWYYWWWNVASFPVIVVFGYLTFYVVAFWVYDMPSRARQLHVVGSLAVLVLVAGLVFGPLLGWI